MTTQQAKLMTRALLWGIIDDAYIIGADEKETRNFRLIFKRLVACGYFSEHVVAQESRTYRPIKRYYMTPAGRAALLEILPADDPLKSMADVESVSIRNGKDADKLARMVRMADTCAILEACGVEMAYTAITRHNVDPFVFGLPEMLLGGLTQGEAARNALIEYVATRRPAMDSVLDSDAKSFYLTSDQLPRKKNKSTNNSLGLLIDLKNEQLYMIFKTLDRYKFLWLPHSYEESWKTIYANTLLTQYNRDPIYKYQQKKAIILTKSQGELISIAQCRRVKKDTPFGSVFGFVAKQDGVDELRRLLSLGPVSYINEAARSIHEMVRGTTFCETHSPFFQGLKYNGMSAYPGTVIDYAALDALATFWQKFNKKYYVFCFAWQRDIYASIVPEDYIIVI